MKRIIRVAMAKRCRAGEHSKASPLLFAILIPAIGAWSASGSAQTPLTMDTCPNSFSSIPMDTPPITCGCSAEAAKKNDTVWGGNPYYYGSSICRAAVHAGAIGVQGGQVTISPAPKIPFFPSVTRNGVESSPSNADNGFRVVVAGSASGAASTPAAASAATALTMDICPNNFSSIPMDTPPIACGCPAEAAKKNDTVWGANPYYYGSSICRAAVHAGAITAQGGQIVVEPADKVLFFPSVTKNGVESSPSNGDKGFRIVIAGRSDSPSPAASGSGELTMEICPNRYNSVPMDTPPITCGCSAEAAKRRDTIWGANPYYYGSSICRAAVHAGAIGTQGGQVTVTPAPKVPFFPAVTKNGVESSSSNADNGFRIAVSPTTAASPPPPPAPAVDAAGKPVQAPIAETLKTVGRVQVYINFATGSDRIELSSAAVLGELLTTLRNAPALRIELVGHTDSQGSAPYNFDLSHRRAASVYAWLAQRGVDRERLRSSGRGLLEPIADNDSEQGRALNRRVEVKAVN
jgi:outer membrane protein OmpA-like peptidoglycan-associated protein